MLYEGHKGFFRHLPNSNNFVGFFSINNDNNNDLLHLYCAFLGTQTALHSKGGGGFPHPPPVCSIHLDDVTAAIVRQNTTTHQLTGGEETSDEANQCVGMIRRP